MSAKKKMVLIDIACVLMLLMAGFFGVRYILNHMFLSQYKEENYTDKHLKTLDFMNFPQGYVVSYNEGNVAYQQKDYATAILKYKEALNDNPPEKKECSIRINMALAMLYSIDFKDLSSEKKVANVIRQLKVARKVLTEAGCAGETEANGHNKTAEQLKKDIDEMIKTLENPDQNDSGGDQSQQEPNQQPEQNPDEGKTDDAKDKELENKLKEQQKEAMQEKADADRKNTQEEPDTPGNEDGDGGSESAGKNW